MNILHFSPALIGLVAAVDGAAAVLGALIAGRAVQYLGIGPVILLGSSLYEVSRVSIPLAGLQHTTAPLVIIATGSLLAGFGYTIYEVNQVSLRQALTAQELLGRTTGARRFLIFCTAPLGAAIGGYLGNAIGLRSTLFVGAVVSILSWLIMYFSPIRQVRDLPAAAAPR